MYKPGDVVIATFPGANMTKRRPGIVVSTSLYQANRPDVVVGAVTTNIGQAISPTDYLLLDWNAAGLRKPSAFRVYLLTFEQVDVRLIGHLSERDLEGVRACLARAIAVSEDVLP